MPIFQGAQTVLHCAVSDDIVGKSGLIFRDCKEYDSKHNFKPEIAAKLWEVSEEIIEKTAVQ